MAKNKNTKREVVSKVVKEKKTTTTAQRKLTDDASSKVESIGQKSKKKVIHALKVTQVKSAIGRQRDQRQTLIGLGLSKVNKFALVEDTDSIRGMINKVEHLIKVEKL